MPELEMYDYKKDYPIGTQLRMPNGDVAEVRVKVLDTAYSSCSGCIMYTQEPLRLRCCGLCLPRERGDATHVKFVKIEPKPKPQEPITVTYKRWATIHKECFTKPLFIIQYGTQMFVVTSAAMIPVTSIHKGLDLIDGIHANGGCLLRGNETAIIVGGRGVINRLYKDAMRVQDIREGL